MGADKHDGLAVPGQIVLAHEHCFRIGSLTVDPPTRQIECGDRIETIEPRVMQVLVALARSEGRVVTRDELINLCWGGRIVGNDALNRIISRIRHLAGEIGAGTYKVQTIAKVGYRLVASGAGHPTAASVRHGSRRGMLVGGIAATAIGIVGGAGLWRATRRETRIPREAQLLFDRAAGLRATGFAGDNRQAIAYLRQATGIAPDFANAWGALALAYSNAIASESPERLEGFTELRDEAVRQARRLDPGNADAGVALVQSHHFGRWAQAELEYGQLIRRYPSHPAAYNYLGTLLMDVGRWNEAAGALAVAKSRNALSPITRYRLTVALWSAGRISEADKEIDEALDRWPQHGAVWQTKVKLLALTGRPRMALTFLQDPAKRPVEEVGEPLATRAQFITALASGKRADAIAAVDAMLATVRAAPGNALSTAINCARLGYAGLAQDLLDGTLAGTGPWSGLRAAAWVVPGQIHPLFQPHASSLWPTARFSALLDRIGLEGYWASTGRRPDFRRRA